jgi:small subunit ribosomal protein S4
MARYTGPVCRLCRREGMKLFLKGARCDSPKCAVSKTRKNYPPGQHGQRRTRRQSEYGLQLREKQRVRRYYGVLEAQFRRHYDEAVRRGGVTGDNLLQLLESRLDNVAYRMGFADSRAAARQLVRHGHFTVNGRKTDIPSFIVRPGDVLSVKAEKRSKVYFQDFNVQLESKRPPEWVSVNVNDLSGKVLSLPTRDQMELPPFNEALIVEYYSR